MLSVEELYDLAREVKGIYVREMREQPFHINVIASAARGTLHETAHSRILADMLGHNTVREHFIRKFVPECVGEDFNIVKTEDERIDVSLAGEHHFIIIENKVNEAEDQPGQVCRYAKIAHDERHYQKDNIHLLYLHDIYPWMPHDESMNHNGNNVFDFMEEEHFKPLSYKYNILPWLRDLLSAIPKEESLLVSAVWQYTNYLELMFNPSKQHEKMTNKTEEELRKFISDKACAEFIDNLNTLQEQIHEVRAKVAMELMDCWKEKFQALFGAGNVEDFDNPPYEYGAKVNYKNLELYFILQMDKNFRPRWIIAKNGEWKNENRAKELFEEEKLESDTSLADPYYKLAAWTTYKDMLPTAKKVKELLDELQS